jgi:hypothetical protein
LSFAASGNVFRGHKWLSEDVFIVKITALSLSPLKKVIGEIFIDLVITVIDISEKVVPRCLLSQNI